MLRVFCVNKYILRVDVPPGIPTAHIVRFLYNVSNVHLVLESKAGRFALMFINHTAMAAVLDKQTRGADAAATDVIECEFNDMRYFLTATQLSCEKELTASLDEMSLNYRFEENDVLIIEEFTESGNVRVASAEQRHAAKTKAIQSCLGRVTNRLTSVEEEKARVAKTLEEIEKKLSERAAELARVREKLQRTENRLGELDAFKEKLRVAKCEQQTLRQNNSKQVSGLHGRIAELESLLREARDEERRSVAPSPSAAEPSPARRKKKKKKKKKATTPQSPTSAPDDDLDYERALNRELLAQKVELEQKLEEQAAEEKSRVDDLIAHLVGRVSELSKESQKSVKANPIQFLKDTFDATRGQCDDFFERPRLQTALRKNPDCEMEYQKTNLTLVNLTTIITDLNTIVLKEKMYRSPVDLFVEMMKADFSQIPYESFPHPSTWDEDFMGTETTMGWVPTIMLRHALKHGGVSIPLFDYIVKVYCIAPSTVLNLAKNIVRQEHEDCVMWKQSDGAEDLITNMQKSLLYEIRNQQIICRISVDEIVQSEQETVRGMLDGIGHVYRISKMLNRFFHETVLTTKYEFCGVGFSDRQLDAGFKDLIRVVAATHVDGKKISDGTMIRNIQTLHKIGFPLVDAKRVMDSLRMMLEEPHRSLYSVPWIRKSDFKAIGNEGFFDDDRLIMFKQKVEETFKSKGVDEKRREQIIRDLEEKYHDMKFGFI